MLLFSQIVFGLNYEQCYPDADRLMIIRQTVENQKGERLSGFDETTFAPMADAFREDLK